MRQLEAPIELRSLSTIPDHPLVVASNNVSNDAVAGRENLSFMAANPGCRYPSTAQPAGLGNTRQYSVIKRTCSPAANAAIVSATSIALNCSGAVPSCL